MSQGRVVKISGPLVIADGMKEADMFDVVRVSEQGLIGEIIEMRGEMAGSPITLSDLTDASTAKTKIEAALTKDFNYFGGSWAEINASDQPREGYFKVALVLSPGVDYHWYREIPNGQWGHKPSIDSARLTDASGYLIYQPQSSDRDFTPTYPNYTDFIAFYEFKIPAGASPTASIQETEQKTYPIKHDLTMDVVKSLPKGMSTENK